MHPVIFKVGSFELRSYGLLLALSFLIGIFLAVRRAKKKGIDPNHIMDLSVILIVSAIVGSRLLYVLFHLDEFRGHWTDTFNPFQSSGQIGLAGLTLLGGVILCFISAFVYLRLKKLPFLKFADTIIPSVAFGEFLTRIGCYLNGCCFGISCEGHSHFCVTFPPESAAGNMFQGVPLIPTQLYSSAYGLIIFGLLLLLERYQKRDGFVLYLFLIFYGLARFVIDFYRFYESSMVAFHIGQTGISVNQFISLIMVLIGVLLLLTPWGSFISTTATPQKTTGKGRRHPVK